MMNKRVVVVGASLAGVFAAQGLRRAGFDGELVVVGEEPHRPYDRPPLSKNYLTDGQVDEAGLVLRPVSDPGALDLHWELRRRAVALHPAEATVDLDDGRSLAYDGLVIATGSIPRRLPGTDGPDGLPGGVHELRSLDDARTLRAVFDRATGSDPVGRIVICGAGFIGAEVAASARARGLEVTLIDTASVPLDRVLDHDAGMAVADLHRGHGVDLRLATSVTDFERSPVSAPPGGVRVTGVRLSDGTAVGADAVVVGIGAVPATGWLEGSGLAVDDGLVTDEYCTVDGPGPPIVAAGDVARWPNMRFGNRLMRVEQWDNAVEMGLYAGAHLAALLTGGGAAEDAPFAPVPWFWSDQYDRKIQLAGLAEGASEVVQGSIEEQRFVQIHVADDGLLRGVLCWNRPRQAIVARRLIGEGATAAEARNQLGG